MRSRTWRAGLVAGGGVVVVLVTVLLVREGLDRADKWASVVGGYAAAAGLLAGAVRRRPPGEARPAPGATFDGAALTAPAGSAAPVRGRETELRRLERLARRPDGRVHVLGGLGGVGKSFVALRMCHWFEAHEGGPAWWVAAHDPGSLTGGLVGLAETLGLGEVQVTAIRNGAPAAVERLWEHLARAERRWLLVFDNLDDPRLAGDLIGSGVRRCAGRGLVLATSRAGRAWGDGAGVTELRPLPGPDAARVLLDLAGGAGDEAAAARLAGELGGLPLALRLAGANLTSPFRLWSTFEEYREALHDAGIGRVLAAPRPAGEAGTHRGNVVRTWEISLNALERHGQPHGRVLLGVLAHYAPGAPIPAALLRGDPVRALLGAAGRDDLDVGRLLQETVEALADQSLVERLDGAAPDGGPLLGLHPVVAETSRTGAAAGAAGAAVALLAAAVQARRYDGHADWRWFGLLTPHVEELLRLGDRLGTADLAALVATAARTVAAEAWRGQERAAVALAEEALLLAGRLGADHEAALALRHERAWAVGRLGRWDEARAGLDAVSAARTRVLGAGHPDTLDTRHKLAWAVGRLGDWAAAEAALGPVLAARTALLGAEHPDTLHTRCCLAWAIGRCGREAEAERRYHEVIAARRRRLGPLHAETLDAQHSLAELYVRWYRFGDAERILRTLDADRRREFGAGHPETLDVRPRYWLGRALIGQGRRRAAGRVLAGLAEDQARYLGPDHAATISTRELLDELRRGRTGGSCR